MVTIQFKYPPKWGSPNEGKPQDFDPKKVISVAKDTIFGNIRNKDEVV